MFRLLLTFLAVMMITAPVVYAYAPSTSDTDREINEMPLPRWQTLEEQRLQGPPSVRTITPPPDNPVTLPGEFVQKDGLLLRWPFYFADIFCSFVDEIQDVATVYILVSSNYYEQQCINTLSNYGVGLENVEFLYESTDAIWVRDYGPWFVDELGDWSIIDQRYYNTRPLDDEIPEDLADFWDYGYYGPDIYHEGGNLMNDDHGTLMMSTRVMDANPTMTQSEVVDLYQDYFGVDTVHIFERIALDGTGHIDLWGKIMNENTILVAEMAAGDVNYNLVENHAAYMDALPTYDGGTFDIVRCPMPPVAYSGGYPYYRSYINSVLINGKAIIPIYGLATDDEAIAAYQTALGPDWEVVGIDCNDIAPLGGALHCVAIEIPRGDPVEFELTGINTSVPAGGGTLTYTAHLVSNLDFQVTGVTYWATVTLPGGTEYGPVTMRSFNMQPYMDVTVNSQQVVPGYAPGGMYAFNGNIGMYPASAAQSTFYFWKTGGSPDGVSSFNQNDWEFTGEFFDTASMFNNAGNVTPSETLPSEFAMSEAYPNPFNPSTSVKVSLPETADLKVTVFDVNGRQAAVLADDTYNAGEHTLTFDATAMASGVYFVRAIVPGVFSQSRKIVLLK